MNLTVGFSILLLYGTFIVLYFLFRRRDGGQAYRVAYINAMVCCGLCLAAFLLLPVRGAGYGAPRFAPFINFLAVKDGGRVFDFIHFLGYIGNAILIILLLMPLGFFTAVQCKLKVMGKPALKAVLLALAILVGISLFRLVISYNRSFDTDEIIYGCLGAFLGTWLFGRIQHRRFIRRYLKMLALSNDVDQILS